MADQPPRLYGAEVGLVVASVVQQCVAREQDRPLVQHQLREIFLRDLPVDEACFNELIDEEELCALVDATKIALKRMYKGFKQSARAIKMAENLCVCGTTTSPKTEIEQRSERRPDCERIACSKCGKRFANPTLLYRHNVIHTRKRSFSCGQCQAKFYRKDIFREHQIRRHGKGKVIENEAEVPRLPRFRSDYRDHHSSRHFAM
ncbi:zinc finger protein, partial [Aphelenchoides avenae]